MPVDFERAPAWRRYLRFWGQNSAADVEAELSFHIESRVAELQASGMSADEARRAALERFGDVTTIRTRCRDLSEERERSMRRSELLTDIVQDLRYGWRSLRSTPAFALVAVLSLALGIGANTAIFGLLHATMFARLALPSPQELVTVQPNGFSHQSFQRLNASGAMRLTASTSFMATIAIGEARDWSSVDLVAGSYFPLLGARSALGRLIHPEDEERGETVIVVSDAFWRERLGADPGAIGSKVLVNGVPFTVIGVTEPTFRGLIFPGAFRTAVPLSTSGLIGGPDADDPYALTVAGRLNEGATFEQTQARLQSVYPACCEQRPTPKGAGARVDRLELHDLSRGMPNRKADVRGTFAPVLFTLMGGVLVLLLIACANVGTLLLARAEARRRELALRLSLGAVRGRLIRQLLTESLQIALLGALLGTLLARWGLDVLSTRVPAAMSLLTDLVQMRSDRAVLGFTIVITLLCTALFGMLPAWRATRVNLASQLNEGGQRVGGRRVGALDRFIIAAQVALALLLVSAAGLLVQTLRNLQRAELGFDGHNLMFALVETRGTVYERSGIVPLHEDLVARVRRIPGVTSVAMVSYAPLFGGRNWSTRVTVPGYIEAPDEDMSMLLNLTTPGYLAAMGIPQRSGRDFTDSDSPTSERVAIVNERFAQRYLSGRAVGAVIRAAGFDLRIVGVAADAKYLDLRADADPMVYLPVRQALFPPAPNAPVRWPFLNLVVRTEGAPLASVKQIQTAIEASAPGIAYRNSQDVREVMNAVLTRERMAAGLAGLFAALALGLAAIGLYGVMAYYVAGRRAEIGTRMALGAGRAAVVWLVLRQSLLMLIGGFAVGVPLALIASRAIATQLYGVTPFDVVTLAGAMLTLSLVGAVATLMPARRATRLDPLTVLRAS